MQNVPKCLEEIEKAIGALESARGMADSSRPEHVKSGDVGARLAEARRFIGRADEAIAVDDEAALADGGEE